MNDGAVTTASGGGSMSRCMWLTSASSKAHTSPSRMSVRAGRRAMAAASSAKRLVWFDAAPADETDAATALVHQHPPTVILLFPHVAVPVERLGEEWLDRVRR